MAGWTSTPPSVPTVDMSQQYQEGYEWTQSDANGQPRRYRIQNGMALDITASSAPSTYNSGVAQSYNSVGTGFGAWSAQQPVVSIQSATPDTSPITTYYIPNTTPGHLSSTFVPPQPSGPPEPIPTDFRPLESVSEPAYTLSARSLLEFPSPDLRARGSGGTHTSSAANERYANIQRLTILPKPIDLCGYYNLPQTERYHPVQTDPTLDISVESDAIRACHSYIVGPVNLVLYHNPCYIQNQPCTIRSISEDVHLAQVLVGNNSVTHISRLDLSWEVYLYGQWQKFAFLEFKRPGAIKIDDWLPARTGNPVRRGGEKICRQLVKYAYSSGVRFVAAFTWDTLVLIKLGGEMNAWCDMVRDPQPIPAEYQWHDNQTDMKRHLYVFLRTALRVFLYNKTGENVS